MTIHEKEKKEALVALEKADAKTLHRLYDEKCKDVESALKVLEISTEQNRHNAIRPSDDVVKAIKEIALSAICLARDVAVGGKKNDEGGK